VGEREREGGRERRDEEWERWDGDVLCHSVSLSLSLSFLIHQRVALSIAVAGGERRGGGGGGGRVGEAEIAEDGGEAALLAKVLQACDCEIGYPKISLYACAHN
jgi:hypothetical protein